MAYNESISKVVGWITDVKAELSVKYPNHKRLKYLMDNRPKDTDLNYLGAEPEIRKQYQKVLRAIAMS